MESMQASTLSNLSNSCTHINIIDLKIVIERDRYRRNYVVIATVTSPTSLQSERHGVFIDDLKPATKPNRNLLLRSIIKKRVSKFLLWSLFFSQRCRPLLVRQCRIKAVHFWDSKPTSAKVIRTLGHIVLIIITLMTPWHFIWFYHEVTFIA